MIENERDLALRAQVITDFQLEVATIQSQTVHSLPDLSGHVNHAAKFTRPTVKLRPGLFLDKEVLGAQETKPDGFAFMAQPGHRLSREKSHNHVFFGKLLIQWLDNDFQGSEAQVAVKPAKNREALLGELAMLQYMQELDIPTFKPSGFLVTDSVVHDHLMTNFEKPVVTMDTVDWHELGMDEKWLQMSFAVDTLALLHSHLLFHGDLEFKNVGFGERGELVVVDPELTVSALELGEAALYSTSDEKKELAVLRIKQKISTEFTSVCSSIDEYIFRTMPEDKRPQTDMAKFKDYNRHLFKPYREALIAQGSKYLPILLTAYEMALHEHKQRARETTRGA